MNLKTSGYCLLITAALWPLSAGANETTYDGTWSGTYSTTSSNPKCNANTSKRTITIKDGVAKMTTHASKDGHERQYTGDVKGNNLTLVSDDLRVTYTGSFDGEKFKAKTGSINCSYELNLERVKK